MLTYKLNRGFTVVELLIVIVLIAILTAIGVVAFNGIQRRAVSQAHLAAVDGWEKLIRMEFALTGQIPGADGISTRCLGNASSNFPATGSYVANECERIFGTPDQVAYYDQSFINLFSARNNFPSGLLPEVTYSDGGGGGLRSRGVVIFTGMSGASYEVHLYWKAYGKNSCGRGVDNLSGNPTVDISACERVFTLN